MRIIKPIDFRHQQLKSRKTGELYSLSDVVSEKMGSNQLFIHQDIIKPNTKSSGAHRHSIIEEVVYVLKNAVTVVSGENKAIVEEGGLILFDPKETQTHYILNHSDQDAETLTFSTKSEFDLVIYEKNENIHKANEKIENEIRSVASGRFENSEVENFIQVSKKIQVESGNAIIDFFVQISTDEGSELELGFFTESHIADVTLSKGKVYSYSYSLGTVKKTDLIDNDLKWTLTILGEKKFDYNVVKPASKDDLIRYEKNLNEYLKCAKKEEDIIRGPESTFDQDLRDVPKDIKEWEAFLVELKNRLKAEKHPEKLLSLYEHIGMASRTLTRLREAEHFLMKAITLSYSYPSQSRLVQNLIRLAHVYQWKKDFEKSQLLFDQARSIINEKSISKGLQAAYHQHLGKLYFDQRQYGRAQSEFGLALSLRNKINAPKDQIESSALSLKEALGRWQCKFDSGIYLRRAGLEDAEGIHKAHMQSIQKICAKDHSPEEIEAWGNRPFDELQRAQAIKNDSVLVIENQGEIAGYGHWRLFDKDGVNRAHIFGLYLTPSVLGKSLGKSVVNIMMEEIISAKIKQVTLEATITAQNFYRKMGFVDDGLQMTVEINNTPIRCYPMKMELKGV